ncbi:hypothetical protein QYE76_013762 [Lolium multiflorum]|uniref:F-box domain-containing protein n=1 Tax=Lolium multiflorum TaxID=4521 RepID=A0AAD8U3Q3_LOLMU|nr:hypothetical protein QYE76_013762 [Lolium multiflorum]
MENMGAGYGASLPDEMIIEVLQWLPVKSVHRFQAVCRSWAALLSSYEFHRLHMAVRRAPPKLLYIAPTARYDSTAVYSCPLSPPSSSSTSGSLLFTIDGARGNCVEVVSPAPCRGLILLYDAIATAYYICNPATRAATRLPPSSNLASRSTTGLGFDARTKEYKVVRLILGLCHHKVPVRWCRSWNPARENSAPPLPVNDMPPAYLDGVLYWMSEPRNHCRAFVVELAGLLCAVLADPVADSLDVWKLEHGQWDRAHTIHLKACPDYSVGANVVVPLAFDADGGRILLSTGRKIGLYDPSKISSSPRRRRPPQPSARARPRCLSLVDGRLRRAVAFPRPPHRRLRSAAAALRPPARPAPLHLRRPPTACVCAC